MIHTATTRFTEHYTQAFSDMRRADVDRHTAKARLKKEIRNQYANARQPIPSSTALDAAVDARSSKEYGTAKASGDYEWARAEAQVMAAYETAELLRTIVKQNAQLLELLNNRLPHKVH